MVMQPIGTFDIDDVPDPDIQEDWIKTPANRASEKEIHDALAQEIEEDETD